MDRHAAYSVVARELERMSSRPLEELVALVSTLREGRTGGFLVTVSVEWSVPERRLEIRVSADGSNPQVFRRLEERVFIDVD